MFDSFCIGSLHQLTDCRSLILIDLKATLNESFQFRRGLDFENWRLQNFSFKLYLSFTAL